jgi:hypothetical protein
MRNKRSSDRPLHVVVRPSLWASFGLASRAPKRTPCYLSSGSGIESNQQSVQSSKRFRASQNIRPYLPCMTPLRCGSLTASLILLHRELDPGLKSRPHRPQQTAHCMLTLVSPRDQWRTRWRLCQAHSRYSFTRRCDECEDRRARRQMFPLSYFRAAVSWPRLQQPHADLNAECFGSPAIYAMVCLWRRQHCIKRA